MKYATIAALFTAFALAGKKDKKIKELKKELETAKTKEAAPTKETEEYEWTNLFGKGACPTDIEAMESLDYAKLSGDWFAHWTDNPFIEDLVPECHHCKIDVGEDGEFTATEEVQFQGRPFIMEGVTGEIDGATIEAEFFGEKMEL